MPAISEDRKQQIAKLALSLPELKKWSSGEWKVASIDSLGVTEPSVRLTHAIVTLVLSKDAVAPKPCDLGGRAWIKINVETMKVEQKSIPSEDNAVCGTEMSSPIRTTQ